MKLGISGRRSRVRWPPCSGRCPVRFEISLFVIALLTFLSIGHGTIRSFRHTDGWGVHTFRFVTDEGKTKLVKFRFRSLQGRASLLWEEAQVTAGMNADAHRQDLFESIENGMFPEWVVSSSALHVK